MAYLLEKTQGKLPLWLSPVQVKIVTVTDRNNSFAQEIFSLLQQQRIRVELDDRTETIGKKVREASLERVNYILTIGDKEVESGKLAVKPRDGEVQFGVEMGYFLQKVEQEIENKGR